MTSAITERPKPINEQHIQGTRGPGRAPGEVRGIAAVTATSVTGLCGRGPCCAA